MGDTTVDKDVTGNWRTTVWARMIAACGVAIAVLGGIGRVAESAGDANEAEAVAVGPAVTTTTTPVMGTILERAITTLMVEPPEVTGQVDEVPQLTVTIHRLNRTLSGAALWVGASVCRKAIHVEVGSAAAIECDVPAPVLDMALVAATTVNVRITAPDGTDETTVVPLDLSPTT